MINHNHMDMFLYRVPGDYPTGINPYGLLNSSGTILYDNDMEFYPSGMQLSHEYENISFLFTTVMKPYPSFV